MDLSHPNAHLLPEQFYLSRAPLLTITDVPVDLFLRFNRVVEITADVAEICRAMQATDSLEVRVCRPYAVQPAA